MVYGDTFICSYVWIIDKIYIFLNIFLNTRFELSGRHPADVGRAFEGIKFFKIIYSFDVFMISFLKWLDFLIKCYIYFSHTNKE